MEQKTNSEMKLDPQNPYAESKITENYLLQTKKIIILRDEQQELITTFGTVLVIHIIN